MEKRKYVEEVASGRHAYRIDMGGTMDGENTRSPVGYQVYDQAFEPNRSVRMENVGDTPLVNAWLIANGRDWRTVESIVDGVITSEMDDAEKALALWTFQRGCRFHATVQDGENQDPVKMLNVYGYTLCGDDCQVLADLWRTAGLKQIRAGHPVGHSTSEVFYDGMWHLLDGDEHAIYLMRDNRTIAGEEEIVRDHDLVKRAHVYGILRQDDRRTNESSAACFFYRGERGQERTSHIGHRMGLDLRPGEALEWRWRGEGKFHGRRNMGQWRNAWSRIYNGRMVYTPDLSSDLWRYGAAETDNVSAEGALRAAGEGEAAAVFEVRSPYAIVGGRIRARFRRRCMEERAALAFSFDREEWTEVWMAGELGEVEADVSLDRYFGEMYYAWDRLMRRVVPTEGPARYGYFIRVSLDGRDAGIDALTLESDLQMAPLSLPGVRLGVNEMVYVDEGKGHRRVRITHTWRESTASRSPAAPGKPVFPEDGVDVEGTRFTFAWTPVEDPDGRGIADYHFQLSAREDMKYALSPNFEKLISRTAQRGEARYEIPFEGLLNPGETYFWRVRARNEAGVWGPWGPVWRFTPQGPGVPLDVVLDVDREARTGTLSWKPNPEGRRPVRYAVYGSDERGFTASDAPYPVLADGGEWETFPSNLIATVEGTALQVVGAGLDLPNTNRAFYRVAAVDDAGVRSGPSDDAEAPRPMICSHPTETARVGEDYQYEVSVLKSTGDLQRMPTGEGRNWGMGFADGEALTFALEEAPAWLAVDEEGAVSGRPQAAGDFTVRVKVMREEGGEDVQSYALKVGA